MGQGFVSDKIEMLNILKGMNAPGLGVNDTKSRIIVFNGTTNALEYCYTNSYFGRVGFNDGESMGRGKQAFLKLVEGVLKIGG